MEIRRGRRAKVSVTFSVLPTRPVRDAKPAAREDPMTLKQKVLLGTGALTLAVIGITGALAAGHDGCDGAACPKSECGKLCPKDCPLCPGCSGN
jgi:hypothetical protein